MLTQQQSRLVEEHLPLVERLASRMRRRIDGRVELDELISIGTVGLIEAARRYDGRAENSFATFAIYRIRGALFDALGKHGPIPRPVWRRRPDIEVRALLAEPADQSATPTDEVVDGRRAAAHLERALAELPPRQRRLLFHCYYADASFADAGREIGVSKSWACRLHAQALETLRREMAERCASAA